MSDKLKAMFEAANDNEYRQFRHIENPLHARPDLCAFLLLDRLVPGTSDMVASATHDEIFLEVEADALAAVATPEDVLTLRRCGVRYDEDNDCLAMFV